MPYGATVKDIEFVTISQRRFFARFAVLLPRYSSVERSLRRLETHEKGAPFGRALERPAALSNVGDCTTTLRYDCDTYLSIGDRYELRP